MASGWIDVHGHFTPPTSSEDREKRWNAMREAKFLVPEPFEWSPEGTLAYMDKAGVAMQMPSNLPKALDALRESNDYAASLVRKHPTRFGLLAALPTDNPDAALAEIDRATHHLQADGFAVTCNYNGVFLGDPSLDSVWAELNRHHAAVFVHPDAYAPASMGRPSPLKRRSRSNLGDCILILRPPPLRVWRRRCIWSLQTTWCMAQTVGYHARQN